MMKKIWLILLAVTLVACFFAACSGGSSGSDVKGWTVTFDKNGGDTDATPTTKTVYSPATTIDSLPTPPTRDSHAFTGWNTQADGSGTPFTASTPVTGDITVYAQWRHQTQSGELIVTFHKNGGDTEADPPQIEVVPPATTIDALPTAPTRIGYTFAGWNTEADGSGDDFTAATPVTTDINVYAQWTAKSFYITCDKNGGDTEANPKVITVTFPDNTIGNQQFTRPSREGYIFKEWNTKADGSGTVWDRDTVVTENVTVYAIWTKIEANSFIVTFDGNGGDVPPMPNQKVVTPPDTMIDALPTAPGRSDYVFKEWNTEQDGSGSVFTATTPVTATITVYAQWVAGFTVIFNPNGGSFGGSSANTTKKVIYPATTVDALPTAPTRSGYTFDGWYDTHEETGGTEFTAETTVNDDITVYARWTAVPVVTFNKNNTDTSGATEPNPTTKVAEGGTVTTLPTPPTRSEGWGVGVVFDGWNTAADGKGTDFTASTPVNADITVFAKWKFVAGTPQVSGTTVTHIAPQLENNSGNAGGQDTWTGTMNADGSATYTKGAIRYKFPQTVIDNIANYDYFEISYIATDQVSSNNWVKQYNNSTNYPDINGNAYPNLSTPGTLKYRIADAGGTNGIAIQCGNNDKKTIKFTQVVFTQGTRHTITFDVNGGTGTVASMQVLVGATLSNLPDPAPRTDGYTFKGWNTVNDGSGTSYSKTSVMPNNDLALFAQWKAPVLPLPPINVDFSAVTFTGIDGNNGTAPSVSSSTSTSFTYTHTNSNQAIAFKIDLGTANLSDYDKISFTVNSTTVSSSQYKQCNVAGGKTLPSYVNPNSNPTGNPFVTTYIGASAGNTITATFPISLLYTIDKSKADDLGLTGEIYLAVYINAGNNANYTISDFKIIQSTKVDFSAATFAGVGSGVTIGIPSGSANSLNFSSTATSYTYTHTNNSQGIAFQINLGTGKKLSDYSTIAFSVNATNNGTNNYKQCNVAGGTSAPAYSNPNANAAGSPFVTTYNGSGNTLDDKWPKPLSFTIDGSKADTMNLTGQFWLAVFINAGNGATYTISNLELF